MGRFDTNIQYLINGAWGKRVERVERVEGWMEDMDIVTVSIIIYFQTINLKLTYYDCSILPYTFMNCLMNLKKILE